MAKDTVLSRELKSLQEELAASYRQRRPSADSAFANNEPVVPAEEREDSADTTELREELREFVKEVTEFFEDAEKNVASHPTASVLGALVAGILIGRLLGRH